MTTNASRRPKRLRVLATLLLIIALVVIFPVRRAWQLAAEPERPKDCGPEDAADHPPTATIGANDTLRWQQRQGTVNDASCLSRTPVHGVVEVRSATDVKDALAFARRAGLKVSPAGVKHSMGGQAFARGGVVLDMRRFNAMALDTARKVLTVESGASWHDIQRYLHPHQLAVKSMQSTDIFTVGGSISVNAHGMDHRAGSVGRTVRAMRVMLADGSVRQVSREEHPDLFRLVIGGYGLFGVILDVDLEVTDNVVYQSERFVVGYREFLDVFTQRIANDRRVGLMYAHLSTSPATFLDETLVYTYREVPAEGAVITPLGEVGQTKLRRLVFNIGKEGPWGQRLKWFAERRLEPLMESCPVARTAAMGQGEACLVSRNHPMHDSVAYLQNNLADETDILHEYFVPEEQLVPFVDRLRTIVRENDALLLNASVRVVHQEDNVLTYAPRDKMLAVVLYLNQRTTRQGTERMARLTGALIDACSDLGGRFFLPYQLHYTRAQLLRAYPDIDRFFAAKRNVDPDGLFSNAFYEKYGGL